MKRFLLWCGLAVVCVAALLAHEIRSRSAARPPGTLRTLADFEDWMYGQTISKGTLVESGVTYTVILGPTGHFLASGPPAYLFDSHGKFIDWTPDRGDIRTESGGLDLTDNVISGITTYKIPW